MSRQGQVLSPHDLQDLRSGCIPVDGMASMRSDIVYIHDDGGRTVCPNQELVPLSQAQAPLLTGPDLSHTSSIYVILTFYHKTSAIRSTSFTHIAEIHFGVLHHELGHCFLLLELVRGRLAHSLIISIILQWKTEPSAGCRTECQQTYG